MTSNASTRTLLRTGLMIAAVLAVVAVGMSPEPGVGARSDRWVSPSDIELSPDGKTAYVSGRTNDTVVVVDLAREEPAGEIGGIKGPVGLALSPDGDLLYAASYDADTVTVIDTASQKAEGKIVVGNSPSGLALSPDGSRLYVCNRMSNDVSVIDTSKNKELKRVPAVREPVHATVTPDGAKLIVSNLLPVGRNDDVTLASDVTIIDTTSMEVTATLRLPTGCIEMGEIVCSPDGKYAYIVSVLARFLVPPTQIARGWINTNALSIIDLESDTEYATVLLDELDRGAANPYGMAITDDGAIIYVTHTGCHEVTSLDRAKLHEIIEATEEAKRPDLSRDLTFLYRNGVTAKFDSGGIGPKGIEVSDDGRDLFVANYYSDTVTQLDPSNEKVVATIALAEPREPDIVRRGEILFHDARLCFQQWQSCASCHPDARADGLRWDLLNDGLGNPKNAKSMLLSHRTPPSMAGGIRDTADIAVEAGIKYILFRQPEGDEVEAISAYLKGLKAEPSPYLTNGGGLSAEAKRGKRIFESEKTGCKACHPAPLYTDLQIYDVGTRSELDRRDDFDTPTLVELYRTGPYLHDGTAVTVKEVLVDRNPEHRHGDLSGLSEQELDDLATFLLSL